MNSSRTFSNIALAKIVASIDPLVAQQIQVRGELIVTRETANKIMTRSRTKTTPDQFSHVSFAQKVIQILLTEYQQSQDNSGIADALISAENSFDADDEDDCEDEDGWEETGDMAYLADLVDREDLDSDDADDYERQLLNGPWSMDPIMQCPVKEALGTILRGLTDRIHSVAHNLKTEERELLQSILA